MFSIFGIQLCGAIEIRRGRGPLAFTIIRTGPGHTHKPLPAGLIPSAFEFSSMAPSPVSNAPSIPRQQKVVIRILWITLQRMFEFEHRIRVIVLGTGDQSQTEMRFRRPGIQVRSFGQVFRCLRVAIQIVKRNSENRRATQRNAE